MAEGGDVAAAALSSTTIEKAVRELNEPEDPEKKLAAIKELRLKLEEWQQTEGTEAEFTLTRVEDDKFLLRFLRTKKFDVERASTLFVNYHKYRHKHAPLLGELTPQAAQATMSNGMMSVLPGRSKDGCRVLVAKLSEWDPDKLTPGDMMKMMLVVMDRLLEDDETQVNGITVIEDMDEMSFFQVIKMAQMEHIQKGFAIELIQVWVECVSDDKLVFQLFLICCCLTTSGSIAGKVQRCSHCKPAMVCEHHLEHC